MTKIRRPLNDASALIAYRMALMVAAGGSFILWKATGQFCVVVVGGVAVGVFVGFAFSLIHRYVLDNPTVETALSIIIPFSSYLLAENLHVSGVLAVVCTGLYIAWRSADLFSHETRLKMYSFWDIVSFLLNGIAFVMIGLQLPAILRGIESSQIPRLLFDSVMITVVAILMRMAWVFMMAFFKAGLRRMKDPSICFKKLPWQELFIISWAGMRGIVSLAAALALPYGFSEDVRFTNRDTIIFVTFVVILITLIIQGLSLPFFARRLKVCEQEKTALNEERELRLEIANGSLIYIDSSLAPSLSREIIDDIKDDLVHQSDYLNYILYHRNKKLSEEIGHKRHTLQQYVQAEISLLQYQRNMLHMLQKEGMFNAELIDKVEQELDVLHLSLHKKLEFLS